MNARFVIKRGLAGDVVYPSRLRHQPSWVRLGAVNSSLRRGVTAAGIALPLAALVACGAGPDADTNEVQPDNAWAHVEDIKVQNVSVVLADTEDGEGQAGIVARLFNNGPRDEVLEAVRLPGTGQRVELTPAEGEDRLVVPAGGQLALGGEGNASAVIPDPAEGDVRPGNAQRVVFDLSETGGVELRARVVHAEGDFADFGPTTPPALPSPTETETSDDGEAADTQREPENDADDGQDNGEESGEESGEQPADDATESADEPEDGTADGAEETPAP